MGETGEGIFSGVSGANRLRALLDSLRHMILLPLGVLWFRDDVGGVDTLARPLETRRIGLLDFACGGIVDVIWSKLLLNMELA